MRTILLTGWNFMRVLRLLLGVAIAVQGIVSGDRLFLFLGIVLSAVALFSRCCGGNSCSR